MSDRFHIRLLSPERSLSHQVTLTRAIAGGDWLFFASFYLALR
ncbi:hypothetical protein [Coleofasciculus sp. H7-2]